MLCNVRNHKMLSRKCCKQDRNVKTETETEIETKTEAIRTRPRLQFAGLQDRNINE